MSFDWSQTLRSAERHLARGKITEAIEDYRKLVDWNPTNLTTLNTLGDLYARAGLSYHAKQIFSTVAQGYSHQGFTSKAIAILKKLLRMDPNDHDSAARLAECYLAQGLRGEAGRQFAEVAYAYERAGRDDKALKIYQRMAEVDPSNTSLLMMLGERWISEGQPQRAHASFTAAAAEYSRKGDDEHALTAYLKARAVRPDEHQTLAAIASVCTARGQAENAIPILCESLERNPNDSELNRILGSTYLATGQLDDAERTFQKLFALDGCEYGNLLRLGERFLENGDLDRAAKQVDGFVDALIASRNEQEALDFLHKILDRDPGHLGSLKKLSLIYRRLHEDFNLVPTLKSLAASASRRGDSDAAIEALKELCALEPHETSHRVALENLGADAPAIPCVVYSTAETTWKYTSQVGGTQSNVLRTASALVRRGQSEDAAALLRSVLSMEPDNLEVRLALKNIYAGAGMVDLAANEYLQIGRISQDRRPLSAHRFVAAGDPCTDPFSEESLTGSSTGFDLIVAHDRRRAERIAVRMPLIVISAAGGWREFTETVEISEAGMQLRIAHSVPPMTALTLSLDLAKAPQHLANLQAMNATQAIVRYCNQPSNGANLVGVQLPVALEQTQYEPIPIDMLIDEPRLSL